jgi:hypothetical protein
MLMVSTDKMNSFTAGIQQHGRGWEIPAGIENLLKFEGIGDFNQEDLLYEYIHSLNRTVHLGDSVFVLNTLPKSTILDIYAQREIPNANFATFAAATNKLLERNGFSTRLLAEEGIQPNEYIKRVEKLLFQNFPVIISAEFGGLKFHFAIVYQLDLPNMWSYDIGQNRHLREDIGIYTFRGDLLHVK